MVEAQRISCTNDGGVVMSFIAKSGSMLTPSTSSISLWQSGLIDLASSPFPEQSVFLPDVSVEWDARSSPPPPSDPIVFRMNGRTASYKLTGTLFTWTVSYQSIGQPTGRPSLPGFPAAIPLYLLPYSNWDQQIQYSNVPVCAPQSADDVVTVCNWAKDNGYQVRPRGVGHGWSPLTLPTNPATAAKVILVDLTKRLSQTTFLPAANGLPSRVRVGTGVTMLQLLEFLEAQTGGSGSAPGFSFPHVPAPGNLTVGGVLAIDAHGTAVPTPPNDNFAASYGSMSNQVLEFTAVCTDPSSSNPSAYSLRTFTRADPDAKALLTHLGRAMVVESTLQVVDNYNLRCQSITNLAASTIFAAPTTATPLPPNSFADYLTRMGRIEIIWFPFSDNPWVHLWEVAPTQPAGSIAVSAPYNYPFADHVPDILQSFVKQILSGIPQVTPDFGRMAANTTANGLDGKNAFGTSGTYPVSRDIWGPSKNTMFYIQDTTLRVTANGYAVHMRKADVQQAVYDFTTQFTTMLTSYAKNKKYPVNSAVEIRVTALDDPSRVAGGPGVTAQSPTISALSMDAMDEQNQWDVALWLDVLTIPGTPDSNDFYQELEQWVLQRFSGATGRTFPEWSKGWAYTAQNGPWTDPAFLTRIRDAFTKGRDVGNNWQYEMDTLRKYDRAHLFTTTLLDQLFQ
jgi:hypothetical protein